MSVEKLISKKNHYTDFPLTKLTIVIIAMVVLILSICTLKSIMQHIVCKKVLYACSYSKEKLYSCSNDLVRKFIKRIT